MTTPTVYSAALSLLEACKRQNAKDNKTLPSSHPRCMLTWQLSHDLGSLLLRLEDLKMVDQPFDFSF